MNSDLLKKLLYGIPQQQEYELSEQIGDSPAYEVKPNLDPTNYPSSMAYPEPRMVPIDFSNENEVINGTAPAQPAKLNPGLPFTQKNTPLPVEATPEPVIEQPKKPSLADILSGLKKPQQDDTLKNAQSSRDDMLTNLLYMKAANTAAQAMVNQKADPDFLKDHMALNENKVSNVKDQTKANIDAEKLGFERSKNTIDQQKAIADSDSEALKNDPKSEESIQAVRMVNQMLKANGLPDAVIPEGSMSFSRIKDQFPFMGKAIEGQAQKESAKLRAQEIRLTQQDRNEQRQLTRDEARARFDERLDDKKQQEAKLSDKQLTTIAGYDKVLNELNRIDSEKSEFDTGMISNSQNRVAQLLGVDDPDKTAFKARVGDQLAQYIKSISGAAVSDSERATLLQNLPNMSDNDKSFATKLAATKQKAADYRKIELDLMKKQGKKVDQYVDDSLPAQKSKSTFPMTVRKGNQEATVKDTTELAEATKEGFN